MVICTNILGTEKKRAQSAFESRLSSMGSERKQMQRRQLVGQREGEGVVQLHPGTGNRGSNACCFCCLTVRNEDRGKRTKPDSCDIKIEGTANCEERPKPTVEEVRAWGQSFDKLMHCPAGREAFRAFLRTEFSEENMLFWLACEDLKKETKKSVIEEKARAIYEDYISILSPKEVSVLGLTVPVPLLLKMSPLPRNPKCNGLLEMGTLDLLSPPAVIREELVSLDSRVREAINRSMLEPSSCTFDDAQLQIYTLMQRDSYPRFMNSAAYTNLLRDLSEPASES
ncbi:regulator of G-protein signaling 20-like [Scleropages formosus]|uniref:Regulator of G-protein signaling 20-like n=1 Tax=Scleropages formosus TaxID=113540 RepID=A0A0P7X9V9_SCLFO|nr:regulator of G-protein signaling 20-like [Scleropages formosus]